MSKQPAIQFYIGDWLKDPKLSMCSPATRGVWMDLLCAMHELGRSGQVTGTVDQLCRLCRCTAAEMRTAIEEIKTTQAGETSERNGFVTVVNRRMQREHRERLAANERVKNHRCNGNVTEKKRESNTLSSSSSSPSNTSSSINQSQSTRARDPDDDDDFFKKKNGNGARSKFAESVIREFVDSVVCVERQVRKPAGLAHTLYESGNRDPDIQIWIDSGRKSPAKKIKGKADVI